MRAGIGDDGVLRPVKGLDGCDAADTLQIIFQQIRFAQRHAAQRKMHAHASGRLMQNATLHMLICTFKNERAAKTALSLQKNGFTPRPTRYPQSSLALPRQRGGR